MFIKSLYYKDHQHGWQIGTPNEPVKFGRINLLVGMSGVGKTQILTAIDNLRRVAVDGEGVWGMEWDVHFKQADYEYHWKGRFSTKIETKHFSITNPAPKHPEIETEYLELNGKEIANRSQVPKFQFNGHETDNFDLGRSVIRNYYQMNPHEPQNNPIGPAWLGFALVEMQSNDPKYLLKVRSPQEQVSFTYPPFDFFLKGEFGSEAQFKLSPINPLYFKAVIAFLHFRESIFREIVEEYAAIFEGVKDVEFREEMNNRGQPISVLYFILNQDQAVPEYKLSSGMQRTFWHLAETKLAAPGTVFLIDEFENSLGVNCLSAVADTILYSNQDYQFIATSHHPYIINNIKSRYWKLVSRHGSVIQVTDVKEAGLLDPDSYLDEFTQLINLTEYERGITL